MNDTASGLRELHRIHTDITRVRKELDQGPRRVRARQKLLENKDAELADTRLRLQQARKVADAKNLQLKSSEAKLQELQVKLNQAKSDREFQAAKGQMDADRMANSVLEDEILEALDKADSLESAIKTGQVERDELEVGNQQLADEVAGREAGLRSEMARLEEALSTAERIIPAGLAADYRRLVAAHGATSLAPLEGTACSNCMTTVAAQQGIDLRTGKFTFCRTCGRLLYVVDE